MMYTIYYKNSSFNKFSATPHKSNPKEVSLDNQENDVKEDIKFHAKIMAVSPNGNASSPIPAKENERKYIKRVFQPPHIKADNRIIHKPNHMNALKSTKEYQKVSSYLIYTWIAFLCPTLMITQSDMQIYF